MTLPFERLGYDMTVWALSLMELNNGHEFTMEARVGVMTALFGFKVDGAPLDHDYGSAVKRMAENLEDIPDFDAFDASVLLARLFDETKGTTFRDIADIRASRLTRNA